MNKPITNLNKRTPMVDQFWKKNGCSGTSLSHQLAEVEGKIIDKSINLIENSPMVTEKLYKDLLTILIMLNHKQ